MTRSGRGLAACAMIAVSLDNEWPPRCRNSSCGRAFECPMSLDGRLEPQLALVVGLWYLGLRPPNHQTDSKGFPLKLLCQAVYPDQCQVSCVWPCRVSARTMPPACCRPLLVAAASRVSYHGYHVKSIFRLHKSIGYKSSLMVLLFFCKGGFIILLGHCRLFLAFFVLLTLLSLSS
jgi:hypothetical protein